MQINKFKRKFDKEGYFLLRNYFDKKLIILINKKLNKLCKDYNNFYPIKNIKSYKNLKLLRSSNGSLKKNLSVKDLKKGHLFYKNKTNSMSLKDPMISIPEINELIFKKQSIKIMEKLFNSKVKLGYIKLAIFFKNNLPINCINYFHTDDMTLRTNKEIKKKELILKISVSLNIGKTEKNQFSILKEKKIYTNIKKQYFKSNEIDKKYLNKIISPKVQIGDAVFFDPLNHFHKADKPKNGSRMMLYIEYISDKNFKHINKTKITKQCFKNLKSNQKNLAKSLKII